MLKKQSNFISLFLILIILSFSVIAFFEPETPPPMVINNNTNLVINNLTVGGVTNLGSVIINGNFTVINGTFFNVTVTSVNYNITGTFIVGGDITADNFFYSNGDSLEDRYLLLNVSNDPLTGNLTIELLFGDSFIRLESGGNKDACLELREQLDFGFDICNDGSGVNRLVIQDHDGNIYLTIGRDTGIIDFYNDTIIHAGLWVDYINMTGVLSGLAVNVSYIYNPFITGYMDIRADPWWLGGTNFEVEHNITANYFFGNTITPTEHDSLVNKNYVDNIASAIAFDFFFTDHSSDVTGHYNMTETDEEHPENILVSSSQATGTRSIFNWTTKVGVPEFNELRTGIYDVHLHLLKSGTKSVTITPKLYNISSDGSVRNLLITFETSAELTTTSLEYDLHGVLSNETMLGDGERLNLELEATVGLAGSNPTITATQEGTTDSHLTIETSSNAFEQIFLRQDGITPLTADWDYGSKNINGNGNITANIFFGDGSYLTGAHSVNGTPINVTGIILTGNMDAGNNNITNINTTYTKRIVGIGGIAGDSVILLGSTVSQTSNGSYILVGDTTPEIMELASYKTPVLSSTITLKPSNITISASGDITTASNIMVTPKKAIFSDDVEIIKNINVSGLFINDLNMDTGTIITTNLISTGSLNFTRTNNRIHLADDSKQYIEDGTNEIRFAYEDGTGDVSYHYSKGKEAGIFSGNTSTTSTTLAVNQYNVTINNNLRVQGGNANSEVTIGNMGFANYAGFRMGTVERITTTNYNFMSGFVDKNLYFNVPNTNVFNFRTSNVQELQIKANTMTFETGTNDPTITWETDGELALNADISIVGTLNVSSLRGTYTGGNATVCVFNNGTLYASEGGC